jgi:hypothetical protein
VCVYVKGRVEKKTERYAPLVLEYLNVHVIRQRTTATQLHHKEDAVSVFQHLFQLYNVTMAQHQHCLLEEHQEEAHVRERRITHMHIGSYTNRKDTYTYTHACR